MSKFEQVMGSDGAELGDLSAAFPNGIPVLETEISHMSPILPGVEMELISSSPVANQSPNGCSSSQNCNSCKSAETQEAPKQA